VSRPFLTMINIDGVKIIRLIQTDSTNDFLRNYTGDEGEKLTVAVAEYQTAGRGQGGNTWESERGKNLLFSIMMRPANVPAARQFVVLEACAVALANALDLYVDGITIKWPNDIYWYDRKISGTLTECDVYKGMVTRCIMGIGVNVNQQKFVSGAPNPVSLLNATGSFQDKEAVLNSVLFHFQISHTMLTHGHFDYLHNEYNEKLYNSGGEHEYEDERGRFKAKIIGVAKDGRIYMRRSDGAVLRYAFKEVRFVLPEK